MIDQLTPFAQAVETLRPLGMTIEAIPGAYRVNYKGGREATAYDAADLAEALDAAADMATHPPEPPLPPMGPCGRKNTRRGQMMLHNRKIAAQRLRAARRAAKGTGK